MYFTSTEGNSIRSNALIITIRLLNNLRLKSHIQNTKIIFMLERKHGKSEDYRFLNGVQV